MKSMQLAKYFTKRDYNIINVHHNCIDFISIFEQLLFKYQEKKFFFKDATFETFLYA